jgi:hypothetical protein
VQERGEVGFLEDVLGADLSRTKLPLADPGRMVSGSAGSPSGFGNG